MKTSTIYSIFAALAVASLLSSCAFMQKGEFAQRKYYAFPRTNHTFDGKGTETTYSKPENKAADQIITDEEKVKSAEPIVTASSSKREVIVSKPSHSAKHKSTPVAFESTSVVTPLVDVKRSDIRKQAKKHAPYFYAGEASLMLFAAVIAAIFVPPLGVYIKDHRTNKWFWITLILCLIASVLFFTVIKGFSGLWALFWLIAAIIALMDVFDIV